MVNILFFFYSPRSGKDFSMSELIEALNKGFNTSRAFASVQTLGAFTMYGKLFQKMYEIFLY